MIVPFGPFQLRISLSLTEASGLDREELATLGMSDGELARLNLRKEHDLTTAHWEHFHLFVGGAVR